MGEAEDLVRKMQELASPLKHLKTGPKMSREDQASAANILDRIVSATEREIIPAAQAAESRDAAAAYLRDLAEMNRWLDGRDDRSLDWFKRATSVAASKKLRDEISNRIDFDDALALCRRGKVQRARRVLVRRSQTTSDRDLRRRIDEFIAEPRNLLGPTRAGSAGFTLNTVGTRLYGRRHPAQDGTYVATLYVVALFIPFMPLYSFLVRELEGGQYQIFGRVPMTDTALWWRRVVLVLLVLLLVIPFAVKMVDWLPDLRLL